MTKPVEIWISVEGRDLLNRLAAAEGRGQRQTLERIIKFAWNRCKLRSEAGGIASAHEAMLESASGGPLRPRSEAAKAVPLNAAAPPVPNLGPK